MPVDLSIIVCTYNPDVRVLSRCLAALARLEKHGLKIETIIVDNNSDPSLSALDLVQDFLSTVDSSSLIVEERQGLTHARLTGFASSRADWLLYVDDDNELDARYVVEGLDYVRRVPELGAFGPGIVRVEYLDEVHPSMEYFKDSFQELAMSAEIHFSGISADFERLYPYGTGLFVRREVLERYKAIVDSGTIRTLDRTGGGLTGGGDIQIVWTALKEGYSAGRTPGSKLVHVINGSKANRSYLRRLAYGAGASWLRARIEVFPEESSKELGKRPTILRRSWSFLREGILNRRSLRAALSGVSKADIALARNLGIVSGWYDAFDRPIPQIIQSLKERLKVH